MTGKVINLRQARKRKAREDKADAGDANAALHGISGGERTSADARRGKAARDLDGHEREES